MPLLFLFPYFVFSCLGPLLLPGPLAWLPSDPAEAQVSTQIPTHPAYVPSVYLHVQKERQFLPLYSLSFHAALLVLVVARFQSSSLTRLSCFC